MKRTIVILALATAFVFAFSAVAQGTWRGFTPIRTQAQVDDGILQGFITFPEARVEMDRNFGVGGAFGAADPGAALQNTAHGGYVTTTTKCVVCHSAHRAPGINPDTIEGGPIASGNPGAANFANVQNQMFLTAGSATCETCHVNTGAQASRLLVEWGPNGGGPHAAPRRGCQLCHNAGIHGLTSSSFNVMNVFMLGNTRTTGAQGDLWQRTMVTDWINVRSASQLREITNSTIVPAGMSDAAARTAVLAAMTANTTGIRQAVMDAFVLAGNRLPSFAAAENRDQQIRREVAEGRVLRAGFLDVPVDSSIPELDAITGNPIPGSSRAPVAASPSAASTWWYDGVRALGPIGGLPPGVGGAQFSAARSLATAYTCGEVGCHVGAAMFNLNWGMGFNRADRVNPGTGVVTDTNASGYAQANPSGSARSLVTGHVVPGLRATGGVTAACGPCHSGNPAGFPTASTVPGTGDASRRAYGCDQCHDMVGVATNSTAWPHGNRNILVYEWDADGVQHETTAAVGNLWMYGGSIARANVPGMPAGNNPGGATWPTAPDATGTTRAQGPNFQGPTSANVAFADQSWTVLTGVTSGRYGIANNDSNIPPAYAHFAPAGSTGLIDGA
ncbi:MAG: hypothetical protein FWD93_05445, partial [Coriobacteriia bacterium]|nr:hypothetical protein [Coriobacteriia bacterium]